MPLSFLWAVPNSWACNRSTLPVHSSDSVATKVCKPDLSDRARSLAVPTTACLVTHTRSHSLRCNDRDLRYRSCRAAHAHAEKYLTGCRETRFSQQPDSGRSGVVDVDRPTAPTAALEQGIEIACSITHNAIHYQQHGSIGNKSHSSKQQQTDKTSKAQQYWLLQLTSNIVSANSFSHLLLLLQSNKSRLNCIHVAAAFKAAASLQQTHKGSQQELQAHSSLQAVTKLLLTHAQQHAGEFTPVQRGQILCSVVELELHPGSSWYSSMLQQSHMQQQQTAGSTPSSTGNGSSEYSTMPQQQQQSVIEQQQAVDSSQVCTADCSSSFVLNAVLLTRLICNTSTVEELSAVLESSWPVMTPIHTTAAMQQLVAIRGKHEQQQPGNIAASIQTKQQQQQCKQRELQVDLGLQLLQHAAQWSTTAANAPTEAAAAQQPASGLQVQQAALHLRAAVKLQLPIRQRQVMLLAQQLLQKSLDSASQASGTALVHLVDAVADLLQQLQQQEAEAESIINKPLQQQMLSSELNPPQQQQPPEHQLSSTTVQPEPVPDSTVVQQQQQQLQPPASSSKAVITEQERNRQLMQQRRMLLLQQQQEEEEQQRLLVQQQQQQRVATAKNSTLPVHIQQQQHKLLSSLCSIISLSTSPGSTINQQGLQWRQLTVMLKAFGRMRVIPGDAVLQQLLTIAGLWSGCIEQSVADMQLSKQQQQNRRKWQRKRAAERHAISAGSAAALLWNLASLAELGQQQQLLIIPDAGLGSFASSLSSSSNDSQSNEGLVLRVLQQGQSLQLLLSVHSIDQVMSPTAKFRNISVTLAAVAKLADVVGAVEAAARAAAARAAAIAAEEQENVNKMAAQGGYAPASFNAMQQKLDASTAAVVVNSMASAASGDTCQVPSTAGHPPSLATLGVSADMIQFLLDRLLYLAQQKCIVEPMQLRQMQRRQQRQQSSAAVLALQHVITTWRHLVAHSESLPITSCQLLSRRRLRQQQCMSGSYMLQWVVKFAAAVQPQYCGPERLTQLLLLLSDASLDVQQLPARWCEVVENSVLHHVCILCDNSSSSSGKGSAAGSYHSILKPDAAARLLHAWALLQKQLKEQHKTEYKTQQAAAALEPHLCDLDGECLGAAALAVATLGLSDPEPWLQNLLPAVAAAVTAALAVNSSSSIGKPLAGSEGLTARAVLDILQSFVLLRHRPPLPLLQRIMALLQRDMLAHAKGSMLVELLLLLVQMRVRPSPVWMRALLLRSQGKLRMLSFNELIQLCWCLAQMGVVPPQKWLDDFADTAAPHVIAWRQRQRQQQAQQQRASDSVTSSAAARKSLAAAAAAAADAAAFKQRVHAWQLNVMHWALAVCWSYRPGHDVGKLQYRLLRELNVVAWNVHWQKYSSKQQPGRLSDWQQQQQQRRSSATLFQRLRRLMYTRLLLVRQRQRRRLWWGTHPAAAPVAGRQTPAVAATSAAAAGQSLNTSCSCDNQQSSSEQNSCWKQSSRQHVWKGKRHSERARRRRAVLRGALMLLARGSRRRAAAVWPRQWGLVAL